MNSRDFCYWLQGFFELRLSKEDAISREQAAQIQAHLNMVFKHEIDPSMGDAEHQAKLNQLHAGANGAPIFKSDFLLRC